MTTRELARHELPDLWAIDRREVVERVYRHRNGSLVLEPEHHDTHGWPTGERERYAPLLTDCFDRGGVFFGFFDSGVLVAAAVLDNRFLGRRRDRLQLKFLHVGLRHRGRGIGRDLFDRSVARARELGARQLYVSATPTENSVRFYLRRGCRVADDVDPDLFELEPDDIHLVLDLPTGSDGGRPRRS